MPNKIIEFSLQGNPENPLHKKMIVLSIVFSEDFDELVSMTIDEKDVFFERDLEAEKNEYTSLEDILENISSQKIEDEEKQYIFSDDSEAPIIDKRIIGKITSKRKKNGIRDLGIICVMNIMPNDPSTDDLFCFFETYDGAHYHSHRI